MRHLGDCRDSHRCVTSHRRRVVVASSSPRRRLYLPPLPDLAVARRGRRVSSSPHCFGQESGPGGCKVSHRRRVVVAASRSHRRLVVPAASPSSSAGSPPPHATPHHTEARAVTTAGSGGELGAAGRLCTWATWVGPANDGTAATACWRRRSVHGSELDSPMRWAVHRVKDNAEKLQHNKQLTEHRQEELREYGTATEPKARLTRPGG